MVGVFFGLLALLGLARIRDYGMGWDEPAERLNAFVSAKYVALRLPRPWPGGSPAWPKSPTCTSTTMPTTACCFCCPW